MQVEGTVAPKHVLDLSETRTLRALAACCVLTPSGKNELRRQLNDAKPQVKCTLVS